jgi:uncharacterized membrane protein
MDGSTFSPPVTAVPRLREIPKRKPLALFLALGLFCQFSLFAAHAQVKYTLTELFPTPTYSEAYAINAQGDVVGTYPSGIFLYHAGVLHPVTPATPGAFLYPDFFDNYGLIVGHAEGAVAYGYMIYRNQLMPISEDYSWPTGMNQNAHIVGNGSQGAWIWRNFQMSIIPAPYPQYFYAKGINIHDDVVGDGGGGASHAFLYTGGKLLDLGIPAGANQSWGTAINDNGQITGHAGGHTFLYEKGHMRYIDAPYAGSEPAAMNNSGQIVGWFLPTTTYQDGESLVPFMYNGTQMQDLTKAFPSGWSFSDVYHRPMAINDAGQIVGSALHNGVEKAYLLTPVK